MIKFNFTFQFKKYLLKTPQNLCMFNLVWQWKFSLFPLINNHNKHLRKHVFMYHALNLDKVPKSKIINWEFLPMLYISTKDACSFHKFCFIPLILRTATQGILKCEQDWKAYGHVSPPSFYNFLFFAIIKLLPTRIEISLIPFILFLAWLTPQKLFLHITCTCDINQLLIEKPMRKCILF